MRRFVLGLFSFFSFFVLPFTVSAHEAYVLPYTTFWSIMHQPISANALKAWQNPANVKLTLIIAGITLLGLVLNFLLRLTWVGQKLHEFPERFARFGPHFIRISIAVALFFSAQSYSFLGPELHGNLLPHPELVQLTLYATSIMILFGFLTELAALAGIVIYILSYLTFGAYILTYLNYFGEFVVLFLFGMRVFSLDAKLFGPLKRFCSWEKYETTIVRILYGLALLYAAVTVKLLHPDLTVLVVNTWHLTQFHWLFPSDPVLVTLGAGIVEAVIGIFIILGFELRLTVLVSLFYITLSLLYFRELVWPHLLLYGISFNLLVQPETFTLDHLIFESKRREKAWWRRIFSSRSPAKSA